MSLVELDVAMTDEEPFRHTLALLTMDHRQSEHRKIAGYYYEEIPKDKIPKCRGEWFPASMKQMSGGKMVQVMHIHGYSSDYNIIKRSDKVVPLPAPMSTTLFADMVYGRIMSAHGADRPSASDGSIVAAWRITKLCRDHRADCLYLGTIIPGWVYYGK